MFIYINFINLTQSLCNINIYSIIRVLFIELQFAKFTRIIMSFYECEFGLCCRGSSLKLEPRNRRDISKLTQRQLFVPLSEQSDLHKHEIANNYRDYKRERLFKRPKRKSHRQSLIVPIKQPIRKQLSREILQIPSFIFPRLILIKMKNN